MSKVLRNGMWALALTVAMVGCDNVQDTALLGPGSSSDVLIVTTDENGYTTATETEPEVGVVTAVIGENGGELNIGKHKLSVPAGAVTAPTTFSMEKFPGVIRVNLTATRLLLNDVGAAGFLKPVRLTFSFENVSNIDDGELSKVEVFWMKADGTIEAQQSAVDHATKTVQANLNHFSIYDGGCDDCD